MARPKLKFTWIANQSARKSACKKRMQGLMKKVDELTILCNTTACLVFFNRDDNKLVVWPSQEVAKSLIERFYSLPDIERNLKAEDQESFIRTNTKKVERKLANSRKVIAELEMDHLMLQLQQGLRLVDLSQTQVDNLISYSINKIRGLARELGCREQPGTSVKGDETPRDSDVASESGHGFSSVGSGSIYLMDKSFFADTNVQEHGDGTHLRTMVPRFNLNLEPSDDDEDMETYEGESSKSGGEDDA